MQQVTTLLRVVGQQCCVRLYGPKSLTAVSNYTQQVPTSSNIVVVPCKRTQPVGPNNVASVAFSALCSYKRKRTLSITFATFAIKGRKTSTYFIAGLGRVSITKPVHTRFFTTRYTRMSVDNFHISPSGKRREVPGVSVSSAGVQLAHPGCHVIINTVAICIGLTCGDAAPKFLCSQVSDIVVS